MQTKQAWDMLHDPDTGGQMNSEEILKLARRAGYTEDQAQDLAKQRANQRMDMDLKP